MEHSVLHFLQLAQLFTCCTFQSLPTPRGEKHTGLGGFRELEAVRGYRIYLNRSTDKITDLGLEPRVSNLFANRRVCC